MTQRPPAFDLCTTRLEPPLQRRRAHLPAAFIRCICLLQTLVLVSAGCQTTPAGRTVVEKSEATTTASQESPPSSSSPAPTETATDAPIPDETKDEDPEKNAESKRKKRRRVLLKTAYDDREIGEEQTPLVAAEFGIYHDENLENYVRSVAVRLLRYAPIQPFEYEFQIVDQEVPNAFALPGGKIYVSRGLLALANSEDELAAVLGHEITHAAERHAAARVEQERRMNPFSMGYLRAAAIAAYGRDQERDADRGGQILAARAGYDPIGIATFLQKLDASERYEVGWSRLPSFLATHPTSPQRSALAAQRASELEWTRVPGVASESGENYVDRIDGLVIGEDPAGGLFHDGRFVHPDLRFSLRFPPGWKTLNSPQSVSAVSPDRDAETSLTASGGAGELEKMVEEFIEDEEDGSKLRVIDRRPIRIGDLEGVRVIGSSRGLHVSAAFIEHEGIVFRLMFIGLAGAEDKYRGRANAFLQSFRPLDEADSYSLEITRIRIAYARQNETLEQLCRRTRNDLELVYTGVVNGLFASTKLAKGQPVKIGLAEPYFPRPREETR